MSKETFYFSHDYNARTDPKIKNLLKRHGMAGYGVYWAIIEDLYNNENYLPADFGAIAFDLRCEETTVKSIITEFGLFVIKGDYFGSLSVQRRMDERADKSKKARDSALVRWSKNTMPEIDFKEPEEPKKDADAMRPQCERIENGCDGNAIKESIVKESKVKENKFDFKKSMISLGVDEKIVSDWLTVRKTKRAANTETAFNAIKSQIELSGIPANECIKLAAEKSWQGFKAEWIKNDRNGSENTTNKGIGRQVHANNEELYCGRR